MSEPTPETVLKKRGPRVKLNHKLPNSDLSFNRHWEVLKAYVVASKDGKVPVSYANFEKMTVSPFTISKNNNFFEEIGFIKKVDKSGGKYLPTQDTINLVKNLDWNKENEVKKIIKELIMKNWFFNSTSDIIKIKGKVTEQELIEKLGFDSGADPKKHIPSIKILIDYLVYANIINKNKDSLYVLSDSNDDLNDKKIEPINSEEQNTNYVDGGINNTIPSLLIGVIINPDTSEEKIRTSIKVILDEISNRYKK